MAQVINILSSGLALSPQLDTPTYPHPKMYASTSPLPHPTSVPIVGMSSPSLEPAVASTSAMPQTKAPTDPEDTDPEVPCTDPEVS